jgi:hypothetical protein
MIEPKVTLLDGVKIVDLILARHGFEFQFRGEGGRCGENFACGEFVRGDRRIELHFRRSLGLVRYHVGDQSASHEMYTKELGVRELCRYPGFSENPLAAFEDFAHDLAFAEDFLSGSGEVLKKAAVKEAALTADQMRQDMAGYVGDVRNLEAMKTRFREGQYGDVIAIAAALKYPERMREVEEHMVEMAKKRIGRDDGPESPR